MNRGETVDGQSGLPLKFVDESDKPVEILPGMMFWIHLDRELAGARGETGFIHPDSLEAALDRKGIMRSENRDAAKKMLDFLASGRNKALSEKIEPERSKR